jgi:hypothetical protein
MEKALMVAGAAAEILAWRVVAVGRRSVWAVMGLALPVIGAVSVVVRPPVSVVGVDRIEAAAAGVATGVSLYAATRAFLVATRRWDVFARHTRETYRPRGRLPYAVLLPLALLAVVGEELFWRGLFQARLAAEAGAGGGALLTWFAFVGANAASASLAILAGAVVGGALWAGLAAWSGGVLASVASHGAWTLLMLVFPPADGGER